MNRDDIIRMAREVGLIHFYDSEGHCTGVTDAPLITAEKDKNDDRLVEILEPFANLVAAAEREACVEEIRYYLAHSLTAKDILNAIRERGEK